MKYPPWAREAAKPTHASRNTGVVMDHLAPAYVPPENTALFKVTEPGWYAFADHHMPVLGPFKSSEECMEVIKKAPA
jgi:hypothetical protein